MDSKPNISIIGPGKVGAALGILARRAGYRIAAVAGRSYRGAQRAAATIGPEVKVLCAAEAAAAGQIVLLTVPDDHIAGVCGELAAQKAFSAEAVILHCSAALESAVLSAAKESCGSSIGSMHPLQTFPTVEAATERLRGAYFFIEGDETALTAMKSLAADIGAKAVPIAPQGKTLYHAAAVMACNYLVALLDAALATAQKAGIDRMTATAALGPMIRATMDNAAAMGTEAALTGPIARGDLETVRRHLRALGQHDAELEALYRALGRWTVGLAQRAAGAGAGDERLEILRHMLKTS